MSTFILAQRLLVFIALATSLQSCGSSERFMQFGWKSTKTEVIDSIRAWGFTHNPAKARWEGGMLNGYRCSKLRVWFNDDNLLQGASAQYGEIDAITSQAIFDRYLDQMTRAYGPPHSSERSETGILQDRRSWIFSRPEDEMLDITTITRFIDYVLVNASRNAPAPFDPSPDTDATPVPEMR